VDENSKLIAVPVQSHGSLVWYILNLNIPSNPVVIGEVNSLGAMGTFNTGALYTVGDAGLSAVDIFPGFQNGKADIRLSLNAVHSDNSGSRRVDDEKMTKLNNYRQDPNTQSVGPHCNPNLQSYLVRFLGSAEGNPLNADVVLQAFQDFSAATHIVNECNPTDFFPDSALRAVTTSGCNIALVCGHSVRDSFTDTMSGKIDQSVDGLKKMKLPTNTPGDSFRSIPNDPFKYYFLWSLPDNDEYKKNHALWWGCTSGYSTYKAYNLPLPPPIAPWPTPDKHHCDTDLPKCGTIKTDLLILALCNSADIWDRWLPKITAYSKNVAYPMVIVVRQEVAINLAATALQNILTLDEKLTIMEIRDRFIAEYERLNEATGAPSMGTFVNR
jgi:hypothetical protein